MDLANELYFGNGADPSRMELADSPGLSIHVNKSEWKLDSYYKNNNYQPSCHKLYLMYDNEGVSLYICVWVVMFLCRTPQKLSFLVVTMKKLKAREAALTK